MTLATSGALSLNQIHVEAGGSSGSTCSLNDTDIRNLGEASGKTINNTQGTTVDFDDFYGAAVIDLTASGTCGFNSTQSGNAKSGYSTTTYYGIGTSFTSATIGSWTDQTMSGTPSGAFNLVDCFTNDGSGTHFCQIVISGTGGIGSTFKNWTGFRYIRGTFHDGTVRVIFDSDQANLGTSSTNGTTWSHTAVQQMFAINSVTLTLGN